MKSLSDIFLIFFIVVWLLITSLFFWAGLNIWGWLWLAILLGGVAVAEIVSTVKRGISITTKFRRLAKTHLTLAWAILILMAIDWAFLLLHLGVR